MQTLNPLNPINNFLSVTGCLIFIGAIAAIIALIYKVAWIIKHRKEIEAGKKVGYCIIATIFLATVSAIVLPLTYYNLKLGDFEERILNQCEAVSEVKFSTYLSDFQIVFIVAPNDITFDVAEGYFQDVLDELQNPVVFKSIRRSGKIDENFGMSGISILFCEDDDPQKTIYWFTTIGINDFNNWRVASSREPEHLDKEYYREIRLQEVSSE